MRLRLGAQAGKHVLVRVQPRGKVPGNYALQQTDDCPCNTEGDAEFNWRMRWPMSTTEKAPTLHIAVGNSYGANDTLGAHHIQPRLRPLLNPRPSPRAEPNPLFPSRGRAQLGGALRAGREAAHGPIP